MVDVRGPASEEGVGPLFDHGWSPKKKGKCVLCFGTWSKRVVFFPARCACFEHKFCLTHVTQNHSICVSVFVQDFNERQLSLQSLANLAKQADAGTSARTVVRCVTRFCLHDHEEVGAPTPCQGTNRERSRVDPRGMIGPNHAKNGDFQLLQSPVFDGPSTHTRTQCHLPHTLLNPPSALRLPAPTTSARRWHSSRTLILAWQTCSAPTASLHAPRG